jgi:hypothetical protein
MVVVWPSSVAPMNPVTIGTTPLGAAEEAREVGARPAVGGAEDDAGVGELVVGDDQLAGVDEGRRARLPE